jgi:hypothetical protein
LRGNFERKKMDATITFPTRKQAQGFAIAWSRYCLRGHVISVGLENVSVTVDNVTEIDRQWIDDYIKEISQPLLNEINELESYCEGLLSKFKQSPKFDLELEFGRLLIKPIDQLTKEERIRYRELDELLHTPAADAPK